MIRYIALWLLGKNLIMQREKTHDEKLANADLQDTLEQVYPLNIIDNIMEKTLNPEE